MSVESDYQQKLITKLEREFPDCLILKNDPNYIQGIPDLTIFYQDKWAMLETKRASNARRQANQNYYIDMICEMSYAAFVCPENEKAVIHELQSTFGLDR